MRGSTNGTLEHTGRRLEGGLAPGAPFARGGASDDDFRLLGIPIANVTMDDALADVLARLPAERATQVHFVNAHCANVAARDPLYLEILQRSARVYADGVGLRIAGRMLHREVRDNVNGTDLFPRLCAALAGTGHGVFLFGGRPGVAESVADWIRGRHADVTISGVHHGYVTDDEETELIERIRESGARVLLVALGVPRQEKWVDRNLERLPVGVALGVGGLFDFYSGSIPRAPYLLRRLGLEWVYRLYQEPGRMWRRYILGNPLFLWRVLRSRHRRETRQA